MRLETGQYVLQVLGARVKDTLAVEVAIEGRGVTLASARGALPSTLDSARGLCVPFDVPPLANGITITVTNEGKGTASLARSKCEPKAGRSSFPLYQRRRWCHVQSPSSNCATCSAPGHGLARFVLLGIKSEWPLASAAESWAFPNFQFLRNLLSKRTRIAYRQCVAICGGSIYV